jgi:hypothetical protein
MSTETTTACGEDAAATLLFRVQFGGGGDLARSAFYVAVDRQSGRAYVSAAA